MGWKAGSSNLGAEGCGGRGLAVLERERAGEGLSFAGGGGGAIVLGFCWSGWLDGKMWSLGAGCRRGSVFGT